MVDSGVSMFVPLVWSPSTARNSRLGGITAPRASAGTFCSETERADVLRLDEDEPEDPPSVLCTVVMVMVMFRSMDASLAFNASISEITPLMF